MDIYKVKVSCKFSFLVKCMHTVAGGCKQNFKRHLQKNRNSGMYTKKKGKEETNEMVSDRPGNS